MVPTDPSLSPSSPPLHLLPFVLDHQMKINPGPPPTEPLVPPYPNGKASLWALAIRKPLIIMGDSNIAPTPTFKRSEVQAHRFPGATLRHLTAVLLRSPSPRPGIRPVVFR